VLSELAVELLPRCSFPARGEPIDCAVSGGPDSLGLLVLASAAGCAVTAYHVDHGLRPGSGDEADVVAEAAARVGARFVALRVDCPRGPNLEARARAARLAALPVDAATGHTADDQAETILLNLLRGAGSDGLRAMREGRRHPILSLRRAEVARLVASVGLVGVVDPMNADPAYRRARVRHELLPLACAIAGRDLVPVLVRQADLIADEVEVLDEAAAGLDPTDARALAEAPVALARRALRGWMRAVSTGGYAPDAASIERILQVARAETLACEVHGGRRVRRSKGRLFLED
jgi:tRNA(Ile)-lysidine synthase